MIIKGTSAVIIVWPQREKIYHKRPERWDQALLLRHHCDASSVSVEGRQTQLMHGPAARLSAMFSCVAAVANNLPGERLF